MPERRDAGTGDLGLVLGRFVVMSAVRELYGHYQPGGPIVAGHERAAVSLDDGTGNGQPETAPAAGSGAGLVDTVETVAQSPELGIGDARTMIGDNKNGFTVPESESDLTGRVLRGMGSNVGQKVVDHVTEPGRVAFDLDHLRHPETYLPISRRGHEGGDQPAGGFIDLVKLNRTDNIGKGLICCHVWPATTTNPLLFSFVPNVVWLPRSLAGYSDAHLEGPPHLAHEVLKATAIRRYPTASPDVGRARAGEAWDCVLDTHADASLLRYVPVAS